MNERRRETEILTVGLEDLKIYSGSTFKERERQRETESHRDKDIEKETNRPTDTERKRERKMVIRKGVFAKGREREREIFC